MGWGDLGKDILDLSEKITKEAKADAAESVLDNITSRLSKKEYHTGKTPVDSGNLLANTIVTVGSPTSATNDDTDTTGATTYLNGVTQIKRAGVWDTIYIQNNTDYNWYAEFEGWEYTNVRVPAYHYFRTAIESTMTDMGMI